jgi:hypothetical protein
MKPREISATSVELPPDVVSSLGLKELKKITSDDIEVGEGGKIALLFFHGESAKGRGLHLYEEDIRAILLSQSSTEFPAWVPPQSVPPMTRPPGSGDPPLAGWQPRSSVHEFIARFLSEIRRIVCKNSSSSRTLGHTTTGALAALGTWVMGQFNVESHIAIAVAAAILVAISSAAKGAFCKMTEAQAREAFPRAAPKTRARKSPVKKSSRPSQRQG